MVHDKYKKNSGKSQKKTSSINLEKYQSILLAEKELNLSYLVRDFLEEYLNRHFPVRYRQLKQEELERTLHGTKGQAADEEETK